MRPVLAVLALLLVATVAVADATAPDPISAASEIDYPPFAIVDEKGEADGFAVELMRAALKTMGRRVQFKVGAWHEIRQELIDGRIQALPLVARTAERDDMFDFSVPYLTMHGTIVVRKGDDRIRQASDLMGKTVLVMRGDIAEEYVRDRRLTEHLIETRTVAEALQRLGKGEADAVVAQKLVAQNLLMELKLKDLKQVKTPLDDYQSFSFAVREGDRELLAILNEGLALIVADGTFARLQHKWLGPLQEAPPAPILPILGATLGALLLAWAVAYLWQRSLLRMVKRRTAELSAAQASLAQEQARRQQLEFEAQLAHIAVAVPGVVCSFLLRPDGSSCFPYASGAVQDLVGFTPQELAQDGAPIFAAVHPDDIDALWRSIAESARALAPWRAEFRYRHPRGDERWIEGHSTPTARPDGCFLWHGYVHDVTGRRRAEEALRERERDLNRAQVVGRIGSWRVDVRNNLLVWSEENYRIFGVAPDTLPTYEKFIEIVHPDEREYVDSKWQAALRGEPYDIEHRIVVAGEERWVRERAEMEFDSRGVLLGALGITQDITDRKRTEALLGRLHQEMDDHRRLLQTVIEHTPVGLALLEGPSHLYVLANPAQLAIARGKRWLLGNTVAEAWPEVAEHEAWRLLDEVYTSGKPAQASDLRMLIERGDGLEEAFFNFNYVPLKNEQGAVTDVLMVSVETTEQVRARHAIERSEQRLRAKFDSAAVGIADVAIDGRFLRVNRQMCAVTGYTEQELLVRSFQDTTHPDDVPEDVDGMRRLIEGEIASYSRDKRCLCRDGSFVWVNLTLSLLRDASGQPDYFVAVVEDISERKRSEEALVRRTEELQRTNAELEEFAYVASHDLKAPLRAVANLALVIDEDTAEGLDAENRRRLRLLRERVIGMDRLIEGLLSYARLGRTRPDRRPVPLGPLLAELVGGLGLPPGFRTELQEPLPVLTADPVQLQQIFQNLIENAVYHHDRPQGTVWIRAFDEGNAWRLEVADDGPGVSAGARQEIFRMFSTGAKGGRTGIGLAVVRKLVICNGGQVEVTDNVPRGALFRITWPK